ncbi:hypothetical protein [Pseudomonas sp. EA_35y_Pfl2_R111]|uniref:hypothetical protein n=1 Tax=Pseudomonas sp. EA_35y_Pfl2_R111 TaxID=3088689 RepID=UPI0030D871D3
MPTLEEQRRATGAGINASRQPTGEAERRAIGQGLIARRRGEQQVDDINAVVRPERQRRTLPTLEPRGALGPQKGRGNYVPPRTQPGGATGIASPLTETDYAAREYWPEQPMVSVEWLLSFRGRPIKKIVQTDANTFEVVQLFAQPPTEEP